MQDEKQGIQAAIDQAGGAGEPPTAEGEQLPLLEGQAPADRATSPPATAQTGPGRPPGARNKRTQEWTDYLLGKYRSPLEGLAEVSVMSLEECKELARELGCKPLEIWERQQWARKELAPYLHQKQPQAVDLGDNKLVTLQLAVPADLAQSLQEEPGSGEIRVLDVPFEDMDESEENQ